MGGRTHPRFIRLNRQYIPTLLIDPIRDIIHPYMQFKVSADVEPFKHASGCRHEPRAKSVRYCLTKMCLSFLLEFRISPFIVLVESTSFFCIYKDEKYEHK